MRRNTALFGAGLLAAAISIASSPELAAQSPRLQRPGSVRPVAAEENDQPRLARPESADLRVQMLSPELEEILKKWEIESKKIKRLEGEHQRIIFDLVFFVEKRATGEFFYVAPDKGRIDLTPGVAVRQKGEKARLDPKGEPFKLQADRPERWLCTGMEIFEINDEEKTFRIFHIPPEKQGQNIMEGPLPFLFGMPADQLKRRYELTLMVEYKSEDRFIFLKAVPRLEQDAANYREAQIKLDLQTFLPSAVKLIAPSGNQETVYVFNDVRINKENFIAKFFKDPLTPNLRGYKPVQTQMQAQPQQGPAGPAPRNAAAGPNAPAKR